MAIVAVGGPLELQPGLTVVGSLWPKTERVVIIDRGFQNKRCLSGAHPVLRRQVDAASLITTYALRIYNQAVSTVRQTFSQRINQMNRPIQFHGTGMNWDSKRLSKIAIAMHLIRIY